MTKSNAAKQTVKCAAKREIRFWLVALVICAGWLIFLYFFGGS